MIEGEAFDLLRRDGRDQHGGLGPNGQQALALQGYATRRRQSRRHRMRPLPLQKVPQKGECLFIPAVEMKAMRLLENLTITHRARTVSGVGIARERFDVEIRNGGGALSFSGIAGGFPRTLAPRGWGRRHP